MLKQNKDGNFDLKNYSQLRSQLGRSNELLFCARIDNYFPETDIPNPLYLTAFYYTKFDTRPKPLSATRSSLATTCLSPIPRNFPCSRRRRTLRC